MDVYIYRAALYCDECGQKIREELTEKGKAPEDPKDEYSYDSEVFPKGPIADGGGESDSAEHCDECGVFLENPLTEDGQEDVRRRIIESRIVVAEKSKGMTPDEKDDLRSHYVALTDWEPYYDYLDIDPECANCGNRFPIEESWGVGDIDDPDDPSYCCETCYREAD